MSDIHEEMEISDRIRAEDEFPHMKPKIMPRELNKKVSFSDWIGASFFISRETALLLEDLEELTDLVNEKTCPDVEKPVPIPTVLSLLSKIAAKSAKAEKQMHFVTQTALKLRDDISKFVEEQNAN